MTQAVVFRVDASTAIGTGHLMRCLTLAARLKAEGARVSFICRENSGNLLELVENAGIALDRISPTIEAGSSGATLHPEALDDAWAADAEATLAAIRARHGRADWVVVDHYGLDARWEREARRLAANVMVIDDLANRHHDCDVLVDQNLHLNLTGRYDDLVPGGCRRLLGPDYALLRSEFRVARAALRPRDGTVRRLLVFFGGVDAHNATSKALDAVKSLRAQGVAVDVIVGAASPHLQTVRSHCAEIGATLHQHPPNIAALMAAADLAIGAAGATTLERLCMGLPAVVITLAPNQESGARALHHEGLAVRLGRIEGVTSGAIAAAVEKLLRDPAKMAAMSRTCAEHVDGRGTDRVVRALDARPIALRRANARDREPIYEWRNAEETRRYSHLSAPIAPEAHVEWFERVLADPSRVLLIGECEGEPIGVLRYDCAGQQSTVSIYLVPGRHGLGFGPRLLCAGHDWLRSHRPDVRSIRAEVLPGNRASAVAFLQSGYRDQGGVFMKELD